MRPARLTQPLTALLLVGVALPLLAQSAPATPDTEVLVPGVLELRDLQPGTGSPLYGHAYFSPYEDLDQHLLAVLDQAKPGSTVYMSYYSLSFDEYPKKFLELKQRGVTVRLNLYEKTAEGPTHTLDDDLIKEGFDVELIPNLRNPNGTASMHTKFTVVNGELVVTGSANLSASASLVNHENIVVLQSKRLASTFVTEWKEQRTAAEAMHKAMTAAEWDHFNTASTNPFPADWKTGSPSRAKTLTDQLHHIDVKTHNTDPRVQTYFSPEDDLQSRCRDELMKANKTVKVAMYTFVNGLAGTLATVAHRGVKVTVLVDVDQTQMDAASWANGKLESEPNIYFVKAKNSLGTWSAIHHKYAVIDDATVISGSYNWTGNATHYNDENLVVVHSKRLARRFSEDFASLLQEYDPNGHDPAVTAEGTGTRVLFADIIPFAVPADQEAFVRVTDAAGHTQTVTLRHSRSTGQDWLGSITLPRGAEVTYQAGLEKSGGMVGSLSGAGGTTVHLEDAPHSLTVNRNGLAEIVHANWQGKDPLP